MIAIELKELIGFGRGQILSVSAPPDASGASLLPYVYDVIAPGSIVQTDGWGGYNGLSANGIARKVTVQSSSGDPAHVSLPGVHRVSSLLKRWILGTHQEPVVPEHLQSYLEQFTFDSTGVPLVVEALILEDCLNGQLQRVQLLNSM